MNNTYTTNATNPVNTNTINTVSTNTYTWPGAGIPTLTTGTPGQTLTYNSSGPVWTTASPVQNSLHVQGDAEINGELKVNGVSLSKSIKRIEERLAILDINESLEGRWAQLKQLGDQYRQLEAELLDKEKMWDILKR